MQYNIMHNHAYIASCNIIAYYYFLYKYFIAAKKSVYIVKNKTNRIFLMLKRERVRYVML